MALKRIKYVSRFAEDLTQADVEAIAEVSQRNNAAREVTGVMASSGRLFYQVLEGPAEVVDALYATIAADPRHTDVLLLRSQSDVATRLFPQWSMHLVNLDDASAVRLAPLRELLTAVVELRELSDRMAVSLERALATELK
ncbi:MAG: BLUF domain-containing protein [Deltaproteobacteria bacterium]|nr:BLUF domain-containing protein [Deltaproteobacteria bacterium]